jgi:nitrogenase subunit NifH
MEKRSEQMAQCALKGLQEVAETYATDLGEVITTYRSEHSDGELSEEFKTLLTAHCLVEDLRKRVNRLISR